MALFTHHVWVVLSVDGVMETNKINCWDIPLKMAFLYMLTVLLLPAYYLGVCLICRAYKRYHSYLLHSGNI